MNSYDWYETLLKPSFAPPSYLFGIVWPTLYTIIFITFGITVYKVYKGKFDNKVIYPIVVNLVSNFLFTFFQFGLKNNFLALLDILVVLLSIIWFMKSNYKNSKAITYAQIPYLLWVGFATILQISITWLNI